MMSLPATRDELRERWQNGERFTFLFFYGHKPPNNGVDDSCFSQWFSRTFVVDGTEYPTAEHWMMAEKARLFQDDEMLSVILAAESPKEAKSFGRKVRDFDPEIWNKNKFEIVRRGNFEKFTQHEDLRSYLLATSNFQPTSDIPGITDCQALREKPLAYKTAKSKSTGVILVEAAGRDVIWGIGLGKNNPKAQDPVTWRGRNLLGFALTIVREQIATHTNNDG